MFSGFVKKTLRDFGKGKGLGKCIGLDTFNHGMGIGFFNKLIFQLLIDLFLYTSTILHFTHDLNSLIVKFKQFL